MAVGAGHRRIAELLIKKGADINRQEKQSRWAPLHIAVMRGNREIVQSLINHDAEINIKNVAAKTPLHFAKKRGHTDIIELLRKHDAKE